MQFNAQIAGPILIAEGTSAAATQVVITVAAPTDNVRNTIYVYGIRLSGSVAPGALIQVLLKNATTTVMTINVPAAWTGVPIDLPFPANHPYIAGTGSVSLTIPSLGGTAIASGQIFYQIGAV